MRGPVRGPVGAKVARSPSVPQSLAGANVILLWLAIAPPFAARSRNRESDPCEAAPSAPSQGTTTLADIYVHTLYYFLLSLFVHLTLGFLWLLSTYGPQLLWNTILEIPICTYLIPHTCSDIIERGSEAHNLTSPRLPSLAHGNNINSNFPATESLLDKSKRKTCDGLNSDCRSAGNTSQ